MATGSSNGSLHVWRVEYTTRPGGNPDRYTNQVGEDPANRATAVCKRDLEACLPAAMCTASHPAAVPSRPAIRPSRSLTRGQGLAVGRLGMLKDVRVSWWFKKY